MHKKEDNCELQSSSLESAMSDYSAGWMAPIGQASAQVPQSMQAFGSMV